MKHGREAGKTHEKQEHNPRFTFHHDFALITEQASKTGGGA